MSPCMIRSSTRLALVNLLLLLCPVLLSSLAVVTLEESAKDDPGLLSLLQVSFGQDTRRHARRAAPALREGPYWSGKNGDAFRTGASAFVAPSNVSAGPTWSFHEGGKAGTSLVRASPLIDAGRNVYVTTIPGNAHKISPNGTQVWTYSSGGAEIPSVGALLDGSLYLGAADGSVIALDMVTGKQRWRTKAGACSAGDTWSITASSGMVVTSVASPNLCDFNQEIVGMRATDGAVVWRRAFPSVVYNTLSAAVDGKLVVADRTGQAFCLKLTTGEEFWHSDSKLVDPMSLTTGGAIVGPNKVVYVTSNYGNNLMVQGGAPGKGRVSAYKLADGSLIWMQEVEMLANNAAVVGHLRPDGSGPVSLVLGIGVNPDLPPRKPGTRVGKVVALDAETGALLEWSYQPPTWNYTAAAGDHPEHLCLPDAFSNAAIGADGAVYIGFQDGRLYAIRDSNGNGRIEDGEVSSYDTGAAFQGSPGLAPGLLVATPCDGVHAFLTPVP